MLRISHYYVIAEFNVNINITYVHDIHSHCLAVTHFLYLSIINNIKDFLVLYKADIIVPFDDSTHITGPYIMVHTIDIIRSI